jgi:hypothetical protein
VLTGGFAVAATEGQSTGSQPVATFTDSGGPEALTDYQASINWGDNSSSPGTITANGDGSFTVSGSHTYAEEGTPAITVTVHHDTAPDATTTSTANVADPAVVLTGGFSVVATEGQSTGSQPLATFTDPGGSEALSDYQASINWGDGQSSSGSISGPNGQGVFTVSGNHTYAEESSNSTIAVTLHHDTAPDASTTSTANVSDAPLTASYATPATSAQSFSGNTATFTDPGTDGTVNDYTATINWGDGQSSSGTVAANSSGGFNVSGTHTYASTGYFTVVTTINDVGGSTVSTSRTMLVYAFAPGGGSFAIGDKNAAVGTSVTFWGAQWSKLNSLSGGAAPASFKGFAKSPTTPARGTGWSTDPGNSAPPPAGPLPAYMAVTVASTATQSGSTISGDTVHIVVVQTKPGYQPDPGHPGTGTVVAQVT